MQTRFLDETIAYDGSQLRAHWILRHTRIAGDALIAFRGPCAVSEAEMADLEDLLLGDGIAGDDMLHFLWERFEDTGLGEAMLRQRLLSSMALETLHESGLRSTDLRRRGDDLYLGAGKLSISIATRSLVSTLIHFAINVTNEGTPVTTASLSDLGVDPGDFGRKLLKRVVDEETGLRSARAKVRAKGEA